jgi:serine/threonine-protein kinase
VTLGKYRLIRQLAVGGMAEVHLASQVGIEGFEKLVVLKRILPQLAGNKLFVSMFLDEARLAATLHHANIVQVFDIGSEQGQYYFAMEYVQGEDVRAILTRAQKRGRALPLGVAVAVVLDVCRGLHYAHERKDAVGRPLGIVHRDVTPSNVIVTREGTAKLLDFGVAKAASHHTETVAGSLKGKIQYMSPEQCRGEPLDRRSDVFALGILLFEITTGTKLFKGKSDLDTLQTIANTDAPAPSSRRPEYPAVLERIVKRALARDLAERYPTAVALQRELEAFARDERLSTSTIDVAEFLAELFPPGTSTSDTHSGIKGSAPPLSARAGARPPPIPPPVPSPPILPTSVATPVPRLARRDDEPSVLIVDFAEDSGRELAGAPVAELDGDTARARTVSSPGRRSGSHPRVSAPARSGSHPRVSAPARSGSHPRASAPVRASSPAGGASARPSSAPRRARGSTAPVVAASPPPLADVEVPSFAVGDDQADGGRERSDRRESATVAHGRASTARVALIGPERAGRARRIWLALAIVVAAAGASAATFVVSAGSVTRRGGAPAPATEPAARAAPADPAPLVTAPEVPAPKVIAPEVSAPVAAPADSPLPPGQGSETGGEGGRDELAAPPVLTEPPSVGPGGSGKQAPSLRPGKKGSGKGGRGRSEPGAPGTSVPASKPGSPNWDPDSAQLPGM